MKRVIVAALAAAMFAGVMAPAHAADLRKRERRLDREIAHRQSQYTKKVSKWNRKHPHASPEARSRFGTRIYKQLQKTERLQGRDARLEGRIARKRAHHRH